MTILQLISGILSKAGLTAPELIALLEAVAKAVPDLAAQAAKAIEALNTAASPAVQAELALAIVSELGNVAQGRFDGKTHPGDGF